VSSVSIPCPFKVIVDLPVPASWISGLSAVLLTLVAHPLG
jgi:hypothetical protein